MDNKKMKRIDLANGIFLCDLQDFLLYNAITIPKKLCKKKNKQSVVLWVPQRVKIEESIELQSILKNISCDRLLIIVEGYSYLKIYDKMIRETMSVDCYIKENAHLEYIHDTTMAMMRTSVSLSFYLDSHAHLHNFIVLLDGNDIKNCFEIFLLGNKAKAYMYGCYLIAGDQKLNIQVKQHHGAQDTESRLVMNGILAQQARCSFKGIVHISQEGRFSRVTQQNKSIILGNDALVETSPTLEVLTNDASCKHGSAIGNIDKNHLFYLQTRGFQLEDAKRILIKGFFDFFLKALDNHELKEDIEQKLRIKMRRIL